MTKGRTPDRSAKDMSKKRKEKPSPEVGPTSVPSTSKPLATHVRQAVDRFREYSATMPPGITFRENESGIGSIDLPSDPLALVHLMSTVGILDVTFFERFVVQIVNATDNKNGTDARAANAALAFIRSVQPRDEMEACLAAQMAATHSAAMAFAGRLNGVETIPQQDSAINGFNKLTRSYCAQMEALKRYRSTGEQKVTVQHVNVSDGGQAIVGNVTTGGGVPEKQDTTS
jgi:hypothetical protein